MGWLDFIFNKRPEPPALKNGPKSGTRQSDSDHADHLGRAAGAGKRGKEALARKAFDQAWRHFHEQKDHYSKHAVRYGMTERQVLALDGSVHEDLANVLRLEGKYDDALAHLLYCVTSSPRPTKAQSKKLISYFSRCGFARADSGDLAKFLAEPRSRSDFLTARAQVTLWRKG